MHRPRRRAAAYAGGWFDWLSPFSLLTDAALVVGYALLGATWLFMKTEGALAERARRWSIRSGIATLALIGLVSVWTPFLNPVYLERWFRWPTAVFSVIVPALVLGCAWLFWKGLRDDRDVQPFLAA